MHKVDGIEVTPGGAATVLRPGGAHIMPVSLQRPLRAGTTLTLSFQRARQLQVEVRVESPQAAVAQASN